MRRPARRCHARWTKPFSSVDALSPLTASGRHTLPHSDSTSFCGNKSWYLDKNENKKTLNISRSGNYMKFCFKNCSVTFQTNRQAARCDLERGHSGAPGGRHLAAAAGRPAPHGPLRDRVRTGNLKEHQLLLLPAAVSGVSMGGASDFWVFRLCQAAGGKRRPCQVHLWHVGGGFLEPCLHGHSGTQRLRQGEAETAQLLWWHAVIVAF